MSRRGQALFVLLLLLPAYAGCAESKNDARHAPEATQVAGVAQPEKAAKSVERKIRYTAFVEVIVQNLEDSSVTLEALLKTHGGYLAKSEIIGSAGSRRTGTWTMKVPVEKYRPVVQSLTQLGITTRNSSDSEDMTEEFIDLEARLKNMKAEEEVLNKLLKDNTNKLDDVLKLREHILKLRSDIERAEGRLKFVVAATSYATINLTLQENTKYTPPTTPTFGGQIGDTFSDSISSLNQLGRNATLAVVAILPWLPFVLIAGYIARRQFRKWQPGKAQSSP